MKTFKFTINGNHYEVDIQSVEGNMAQVEVNGTSYTVEIEKAVKQVKTPVLVRKDAVPSTDSDKATTKTAKPTEKKGAGAVKSPLPGTILEIDCRVGDAVKIGTKLLVIEAMKMENTINSDKAGVVKAIHVGKGDSVLEGDLLIEIGD